MMSEKQQAAAAIVRAKNELEQALRELEKMPAIDPGAVAFSAHALKNYLTVTGITVELLLLSLASHPDPQIHKWLEGLGHVTELMRHSVNQLVSSSANKDTGLRFVKWDLGPLVQRACSYYQRIADRKNILIACEPGKEIPSAWTDPVAVAVVMDNLLSNAIKYSFPGKRVWVRMRGEETSVVCTIRDEGPGLSREDQEKLFQKGIKLTPEPTGGESSNGYGLPLDLATQYESL